IYKQLTPTPDQYQNVFPTSGWWNQASYFALAQSRVKSYECPADQPTAYQSVRGTFVVFYCDATTLTLTGGYYPNPTRQLFSPSHYAGCAGSIGPGTNQFYGKWYGIMTDPSATTLPA